MKFWKNRIHNPQPDPLWDMRKLPRVGYFSKYNLFTGDPYQAPLYQHNGNRIKVIGKTQNYVDHNEGCWGTSFPNPNKKNENQGWLGCCLNGHWEPYEIVELVHKQGHKIRRDI